MKRRTLTEEQKRARDERRARFRAMVKQVCLMSDEQRAAMTMEIGALPTCEGRVLSLTNTLLAIMQRPSITMVGGFRQWLRVGRVVRKGEHGVMIWIPLNAAKGDKTASDESGTTAADADERRFGTATVFDVSQTDPVPEGEAVGVTVAAGEEVGA